MLAKIIEWSGRNRFLVLLATLFIVLGGIVAAFLVVIGVFGPNGPPQCSGLDVVHFDETKIKQLLGPDFAIISQERREHTTPSGNAQEFLWTSATRIR